jgi:glycerate 2-kinase
LDLRRDALKAVTAAIRSANPELLMRRALLIHGSTLQARQTRVDLSDYRRILVIGGGKACAGMVAGLERVLGGWITSGLVNVPDYLKGKSPSPRIGFNPTTHPLPSQSGVNGVKRMLSLIGTPAKDDLVICVVSGGASSMMPFPAPGLRLSEKRQVTQTLLASGASIVETNTVRKHLSRIKGGRLAELLFPATILTLILSDVVGNRIENIGSGPTAPDPSTYADAKQVLEKYRAWDITPRPARKILENGVAGRIRETPKPGSRLFRRVFNVIIGDNSTACQAAVESLRHDGYRTRVLSTSLEGDARRAGRLISRRLWEVYRRRFSLGRPVALVIGGETTVTVRAKGKGGRNQELVLSASLGISEMTNVLIASAGTDGVDGNTDAAGAIADGTTVRRGLKRGLSPEEYLGKNASYSYFRRLGDLIKTGPTGTNVNDITIALSGVSRE